jgi:hypothetical protein
VDFAYVTDLPPMPQPRVTQYWVWVCRCTGCGRQVRGEHPDLAPDPCGTTALGCRWKDLPDRYGSSVTCWRRLDQLKRGQQIGLTRRGKGSKLMLVVESHGLPIGGLVTSAQKAEVKLAEPTLLIR